MYSARVCYLSSLEQWGFIGAVGLCSGMLFVTEFATLNNNTYCGSEKTGWTFRTKLTSSPPKPFGVEDVNLVLSLKFLANQDRPFYIQRLAI